MVSVNLHFIAALSHFYNSYGYFFFLLFFALSHEFHSLQCIALHWIQFHSLPTFIHLFFSPSHFFCGCKIIGLLIRTNNNAVSVDFPFRIEFSHVFLSSVSCTNLMFVWRHTERENVSVCEREKETEKVTKAEIKWDSNLIGRIFWGFLRICQWDIDVECLLLFLHENHFRNISHSFEISSFREFAKLFVAIHSNTKKRTQFSVYLWDFWTIMCKIQLPSEL